MSVQKNLVKRQVISGSSLTAALATGIPGERSDTAPVVASTEVLTAASQYGFIAAGGLVINPKEGVRFGNSFADGLAVAANEAVAIATKGHFFVELELAAKAAIAKGATVEASTANGGRLTLSATSGTPGSNNTIYGKVLTPIAYSAASGSNPESGAEQFRVENGKFYVVVAVELV